MPSTLDTAWSIAQFVVNLLALVAGGIVWKLYLANLKASIASKDAAIQTVEKNLDLWKDKANELEKRSPEFIEQALSKRISVREDEIARLSADQEVGQSLLEEAMRDKKRLENDLARTRGFLTMLTLDDPEGEGESDEASPAGEPGELSVKLLGVVGVDSGQLMVTDPCYIDSEWQVQPVQASQAPTDVETGRMCKHREDLVRFDGEADGLEGTADQTIASGRLIETPNQVEGPFPYSYRGACNATRADGFGELTYRKGHVGAGVVFLTAWGDGSYPVYGELIDGRIVRIYISVG